MRIKTLASLTGASQKALRHYEALGLLGVVPREGRYRAYGPAHLALVMLIRRAQHFGFALAELRAARDGQRGIAWGRVLQLVQQKQAALQAEQARLAAQLDELAAIALELSQCPEVDAPADCVLPPQAPSHART
jgi:MerR family transcriptional regulator, copper efflux regulator